MQIDANVVIEKLKNKLADSMMTIAVLEAQVEMLDQNVSLGADGDGSDEIGVNDGREDHDHS